MMLVVYLAFLRQ